MTCLPEPVTLFIKQSLKPITVNVSELQTVSVMILWVLLEKGARSHLTLFKLMTLQTGSESFQDLTQSRV